ncbi:MAG: hypothetical protein H6534_03835 [Chthonomonadaceae bacterium]|nr:hypothetical protein [Chthonomonadaceae bacterium]
MVDREARDRLAEGLRRLLSGRIDNLEFDDLEDWATTDRALDAIFSAAWLHYDDFRSHPLRLTGGQRLNLMRCIVFLHTDFEYEWAPPECFMADLLRRLLDGLTGRRFGLWPKPERNEWLVWPFARPEHYAKALKHPRLLSGKPFGESCRVAGV